MRILHTSDWHLGRVLHEFPLLEDQGAILDQVLDRCRATAYDALLVSGDLFDRSLPSEDAIRLWSRFLRDLRAACPGLPLLVIAGNHDSGPRIAYAADALALAGIHVRGGADALAAPVELRAGEERMQVWMLPFLWAGDLDAGGGERRIRTQEETLKEALDRIRPLQDPGALQVAMAHCFARGGAPADSERTLIGTATDVDAGLFEGFHYTALGHLHRGQRVGPGVWYSGSPLPYSFSEAGDAKGMLDVELRPGLPPAVTRIPLAPPHPMRRRRGALRDLLEDPRYQEDEACFLELTLKAEDAGANPFALLKRRFPFLLNLDYERDGAPPEAAARAAALPGDLLSDYREFAAAIGLDPETAQARAALTAQLVLELSREETA